MIRVKVPLDLHAVATGSTAFALATPLRVRHLLSLAVRDAIGTRAPRDMFARNLRRTLAGFEHGAFTLTVNGRVLDDADSVVVCEGIAEVRFFLNDRFIARATARAQT